jgi:hypothetical protein
MLRRLLETLLILQATSDAPVELGKRLLSIGSFLRIDSVLLLQYLTLRIKNNTLARM